MDRTLSVFSHSVCFVCAWFNVQLTSTGAIRSLKNLGGLSRCARNVAERTLGPLGSWHTDRMSAMSAHNRKGLSAKRPFGEAKFVRFTLSADQVAAIKAASWTSAQFDEVLTRLCEANYKTSFKYDDYNKCFMVSLIPPDTSVNAGWILCGRGSTPVKALKQASYMHYNVFSEDWPSYQTDLETFIDD